ERPIEGDWPYLWIDATYLKVRRGGRIVSVAVIIAVGVNADGRREVRHVGGRADLDRVPAQADPAWPARREARRLGCARRPESGRYRGSVRHLAEVSGSLHEECAGARRKERTTRRLGLHRHCLRPGD